MAQVRQLLQALLVPDTNIVSQATKALKTKLKELEASGNLLQLLDDSDANIRQLAAVLLRKVLPDRIGSASPTDVAIARAAVTNALAKETNGPVRSALIALTASVAAASRLGKKESQPWPEIVTAALTDSSDTGLQLLSALLESCGSAIFEKTDQLIVVLRDAFQKRSPRSIRAYASALTSGIVSPGDHVTPLISLMPMLVDTLKAFGSMNPGSDDFARVTADAFECCQMVTHAGGKDIQGQFESMVKLAADMFRFREAASQARNAAADYLMFAALSKPKTMRHLKSIPSIFTGVCEVASEFRVPEDDDDDDDNEDEVPCDIALRVLESLAARPEFTQLVFQAAVMSSSALLESCKAPHISPNDRDSLASSAFRLMAAISEGCSGFITEHVGEIVPKLVNGASSNELGPRARANALNAMAHVFEWLDTDEMSSTMISDVSGIAISSVTTGMRSPVKQIREASCTALQPVLNMCLLDTSSLQSRFQDIISALGSLGQNAAVEAVVAVGILAENVPDEFFALPCLPDLIRATLVQMARTDEESTDARVYGLETAGCLVSACKDEGLVGELAQVAITGLDCNEPNVKRATFMFFARMADAMGPATVISYGQRVLQVALESMQRDDVEFTPEDDEGNGAFQGIAIAFGNDENGIEENEDDEEVGKGTFHVRTAFLDEKTTSIAVCGAFASASSCAEYVALANQHPQVANDIRGLLENAAKCIDSTYLYFHEEVRVASQKASVRYAIANVSLSKIAPQLMFTGTEIVSATVQRLNYGFTEDDDCWAVTGTLSPAVVLCDELPPDVLREYTEMLVSGLQTLIRGESECQRTADDDPELGGFDDDAEMGDDLTGVTEGICDLVEALVRSQRGLFAKDAAELFSLMASHMYNVSPRNRGVILGCAAGVLLFLGWDRCTSFEAPAPGTADHETALQVIDTLSAQLLPSALDALCSGKGKTLERNAVFVIGAIFQRARPSNQAVWSQLDKAIEILTRLMDNKNDDTAALVDNAAGAIARIVTSPGFHGNGPLGNYKSVMQLLMSAVPMMGDPQESTTVSRAIVVIAERDADALMNHVDRAVSCLVSATLLALAQRKREQTRRVVGERQEGDENDHMTRLSDDECNRVVQLLAQLQSRLGDEPFRKLNLEQDDANSLAEVLRPHLR